MFQEASRGRACIDLMKTLYMHETTTSFQTDFTLSVSILMVLPIIQDKLA